MICYLFKLILCLNVSIIVLSSLYYIYTTTFDLYYSFLFGLFGLKKTSSLVFDFSRFEGEFLVTYSALAFNKSPFYYFFDDDSCFGVVFVSAGKFMGPLLAGD